MICKRIYDSALRLLGDPCIADEVNDYENRAPYLIATFCCEASTVDAEYRLALKLPKQKKFDCVSISLHEEFPLSERFLQPAAHYLASMLIIDENESLSDKLFERCGDMMHAIYAEIPATVSEIKNKYIVL